VRVRIKVFEFVDVAPPNISPTTQKSAPTTARARTLIAEFLEAIASPLV